MEASSSGERSWKVGSSFFGRVSSGQSFDEEGGEKCNHKYGKIDNASFSLAIRNFIRVTD